MLALYRTRPLTQTSETAYAAGGHFVTGIPTLRVTKERVPRK